MIFLASRSSNTQPATTAFQQRGLQQYTCAKISTLNLLAKANHEQLAFAGYSKSIEAFVHATVVQRKVATNQADYPIPETFIPTVPIMLPPLIIAFRQRPSSTDLASLKEKFEKLGGLQELNASGKGLTSFIVPKPSLSFVLSTMGRICQERAMHCEGHAQAAAAWYFAKIIQCVDAYLATNTYFYRHTDIPETFEPDPTSGETFDAITETRVTGQYFRPGYGTRALKKVKTQVDFEAAQRRKVTPDELQDLTPHMDAIVSGPSAVLVAKPSPKPSSINYGPPSAVPNHPGILFPYFKGMITNDAPGIRGLVGQHFFRNLGTSELTARESWTKFREHMGTFASTEAGHILHHILVGVDLSLQTQSRLFLLFDKTVYLGFVLLGGDFSVHFEGKWHSPLKEELLRAELNEIKTHEGTLEDLALKLSRCALISGMTEDIPVEKIKTHQGLADVLARVDVLGENSKVEEEISEIMMRLSFPTQYLAFKPENIARTIADLVSDSKAPVPSDTVFYIPLRGWSLINQRKYQLFAQYGPTSFSFRTQSGTEYNIPKQGERDIMAERKEDGKLRMPVLYVGDKVIQECMKDWDQLIARKKIRVPEERAKGSRLKAFTEKSRDVIWGALVTAANQGKLGTSALTEEETEVGGKRKATSLFAGTSHDFTFDVDF